MGQGNISENIIMFVVSEWFEQRSKLNIQTVIIEDIEFEIMALDSAMVEECKQIDDYDELLEFAADNGLSFNRQRVADDKDLSKDLPALWSHEKVNKDVDPCVRHQLGEKVIGISGLTDYSESLLLEPVVDGDNLTEEDLTQSLGEFTAQNGANA